MNYPDSDITIIPDTIVEAGTARVAVVAVEDTDALSAADARRRAARHALGLLIGCDEADVRVDHRADGLPLLVGHPDIHISLSHCRDFAAAAIDPVCCVGVDIENARYGQLARVAPRFLTPAECEIYDTPERLLEAWTLKEAMFKAMSAARDSALGIDLRRDIDLVAPPCRVMLGARVGSCRLALVTFC